MTERGATDCEGVRNTRVTLANVAGRQSWQRRPGASSSLGCDVAGAMNGHAKDMENARGVVVREGVVGKSARRSLSETAEQAPERAQGKYEAGGDQVRNPRAGQRHSHRAWRYPSQVERTCAAWEERMAFDSGRPTPMEFVVLDG